VAKRKCVHEVKFGCMEHCLFMFVNKRALACARSNLDDPLPRPEDASYTSSTILGTSSPTTPVPCSISIPLCGLHDQSDCRNKPSPTFQDPHALQDVMGEAPLGH